MNPSLVHSPGDDSFFWQKPEVGSQLTEAGGRKPEDGGQMVSQPFKTRVRAFKAKIHGRLRWRRATEIRPGGKR